MLGLGATVKTTPTTTLRAATKKKPTPRDLQALTLHEKLNVNNHKHLWYQKGTRVKQLSQDKKILRLKKAN